MERFDPDEILEQGCISAVASVRSRRPATRRPRARLAASALLAVSACASDPGPDRGASLCAADEAVVFSCATDAGGKLASLCSSPGLDRDTGYLQYRFGAPGRIELAHPEELAGSASAFLYARYTRPRVTYLELRFAAGGSQHAIHQDFDAEQDPPVAEAYIEVGAASADAGDAAATVLRCRGAAEGSLMALEDFVPRGEW